MSRFVICAALILCLVTIAACGNGDDGPVEDEIDDAPAFDLDDLEATVLVENLEMPGALTFAPDGRLFFAEVRSGRIRIVENGELLEEPFAELDVHQGSGYTEHGLLGLTLPPDFEENGYVYAFYTARTDPPGQPAGQRIVRITAEGNSSSEEEILVEDLPFGPNCCHNGGRIAFGPDGHLYATIGDIEDPQSSQNPETLSGSVLRYSEDGAIPEDIPFGSDSPVYAYGLRNPFGLAFNPDTGELFLTDNGPQLLSRH